MWRPTRSRRKHNRSSCTVVSPPITPVHRLPPNTITNFLVPNGLIGVSWLYIWLLSPPVFEHRRFFVSPDIGSIGRDDWSKYWLKFTPVCKNNNRVRYRDSLFNCVMLFISYKSVTWVPDAEQLILHLYYNPFSLQNISCLSTPPLDVPIIELITFDRSVSNTTLLTLWHCSLNVSSDNFSEALEKIKRGYKGDSLAIRRQLEVKVSSDSFRDAWE